MNVNFESQCQFPVVYKAIQRNSSKNGVHLNRWLEFCHQFNFSLKKTHKTKKKPQPPTQSLQVETKTLRDTLLSKKTPVKQKTPEEAVSSQIKLYGSMVAGTWISVHQASPWIIRL